MLRASATSSATVHELWAHVGNPVSWPTHLPTFTSVTPATEAAEQLRPGARFDVRQPGLAASTYEVTRVVPGSSFTWVSRSPGIVTTAAHEVSKHPDGSRVDLSIEWTGLLAPLVQLLLGRRTTTMIEVEAATLARVASLADPHG